MDTRDLITSLSGEAAPVDARSFGRVLALCVIGALVYCVVAIVALAGLRPDLAANLPWVAAKAGLSLAFSVCAIPLALRAARPGRRAGLWGAAVLALFGAAIITACVATATLAPDARLSVATGGGFPHIVLVVPVLAIPVAALVMVWMRRQAPTRPMQAGASAGVLAGSLAAAAYALTCPVDATAFVAGAYTVSILLCGCAGAIVGRYALRW